MNIEKEQRTDSQLTSRDDLESFVSKTWVTYDIPIDLIVPNPDQPRKIFDREELLALAEKMKTDTVRQTIDVEPYEEGKVRIRGGERRWRAAQIANFATLPCVFHEEQLDRAGVIADQLRDNYGHSPLKPCETGRAIQDWMDDEGVGISDAAVRFVFTEERVRGYLAFTKLPLEIQDQIDTKRLTQQQGMLILKNLGKQNEILQLQAATLFIAGKKDEATSLFRQYSAGRKKHLSKSSRNSRGSETQLSDTSFASATLSSGPLTERTLQVPNFEVTIRWTGQEPVTLDDEKLIAALSLLLDELDPDKKD